MGYGVLLRVIDNIKVKIGWGKHPTHPWVGGVLLSMTNDIQG
jgi:hypothetical protein